MNTAKYYFECHITIEPVFDERRELVAGIVSKYGFRLAELLMQKRAEDTPERSKHDTFATAHSKDYCDIVKRVSNCVLELKRHGFKVYRYKIEDIIVDSRHYDEFRLLEDYDGQNELV